MHYIIDTDTEELLGKREQLDEALEYARKFGDYSNVENPPVQVWSDEPGIELPENIKRIIANG